MDLSGSCETIGKFRSWAFACCLTWADHLSNAVETLAVELKCLFEEHLVLYRPLVREGSEVGQVDHRFLQVVLVPEEHSKSLFRVVAILLFRQTDVLLDCGSHKDC